MSYLFIYLIINLLSFNFRYLLEAHVNNEFSIEFADLNKCFADFLVILGINSKKSIIQESLNNNFTIAKKQLIFQMLRIM